MRFTHSTVFIWVARVTLLATILAAWQWLPSIQSLRHVSVVFNPFFISSPQRIYERVRDLSLGSNGYATMWPKLWSTLRATLIGVGVGTVAGMLAGLILSNNVTMQRIWGPFVTFVNSMPRIALVPVFIIIAGPTTMAAALTAIFVVFFLVFYNAFAGGQSVPRQTVQNARLLGATEAEIMRTVRLPYVLVWTVTALPNAISFGLVAVVTAEMLTGSAGMGALLTNSISSVDSSLTFTVVVVLSVVGAALVAAANKVAARALHWWETS